MSVPTEAEQPEPASKSGPSKENGATGLEAFILEMRGIKDSQSTLAEACKGLGEKIEQKVDEVTKAQNTLNYRMLMLEKTSRWQTIIFGGGLLLLAAALLFLVLTRPKGPPFPPPPPNHLGTFKHPPAPWQRQPVKSPEEQ